MNEKQLTLFDFWNYEVQRKKSTMNEKHLSREVKNYLKSEGAVAVAIDGATVREEAELSMSLSPEKDLWPEGAALALETWNRLCRRRRVA